MKRKILYIGAVAIISLTTFIIGRNSAENVPEQAQETVTEMPETYIDTEEIESVTIGTEGLELNFSDGTGYYIETDVTPDSGYINVNDIKGWETWNDNEKVYLSGSCGDNAAQAGSAERHAPVFYGACGERQRALCRRAARAGGD